MAEGLKKTTCVLIYKPAKVLRAAGIQVRYKESVRFLMLFSCSSADPVFFFIRIEDPGSQWNGPMLGIGPTRYRNVSSFTHFLALPSGLSGFGAFVIQVGHVMPLLTRS